MNPSDSTNHLVIREQAQPIAQETVATVKPAIAELLAAGDGLCRLIADGTAGRLDTDMAALDRWLRACQSLKDALA